MDFKHTKGDWFVSGSTSIVSMPSQCKIANRVSGWTYEEAKANAQLIATAPELLRALIDVRKWYEENHVEYLKELTPVCFSKALSVIQTATDN